MRDLASLQNEIKELSPRKLKELFGFISEILAIHLK